MTDSTWIRSYGSKSVYLTKKLRADEGVFVGDDEGFYRYAEDHIKTTDSLTVSGTTTLSGDLKATSNSPESCAWSSQYDAGTAGAWGPEAICPNGKFLAGVNFKNNTSSNRQLDMWKIYCCEL